MRKFDIPTFIISIIIGIVAALSVYFLFIQTPLVSKREIVLTVLLFLGFLPGFYFLLEKVIIPRLRTFTQKMKLILIFLSGLFGFFILFTTNQPTTYFLLPRHTLLIRVPAASVPGEENRTIAITGFSDGWNDVSFSQFEQTGTWQREPNRISHRGSSSASLEWSGRVNNSPKIEFESTPLSGQVEIIWDGQSFATNLSGEAGNTVTSIVTLMNSQVNHLDRIVYFIFSSFVFLCITVIFLKTEIGSKTIRPRHRFSWLLYSLPMIAVWGFFLLTFFPGMMSPDSNNQWNQLLSGQFNNAHPVFHTLSMWLITRIWLTPAAVAIVQILFLSLTIAWGIRLLEEHGLPFWGSWLLAAIFAISPLNANMVIILWKDIPYSTSLFLFSLLVLKIVLTRGEWLQKRFAWVWLGLVSLFITSFRHNGLPIPIVTILFLLVFYRKWWKPLIEAFVLTTILYAVIQGPFYRALNVEKPGISQFEFLMMHHIAAHINHGQPLSPAEQDLANSIVPEGTWGYNCCTVLSTTRSTGLSDFQFSIQGQAIRKLFFILAFKRAHC